MVISIGTLLLGEHRKKLINQYLTVLKIHYFDISFWKMTLCDTVSRAHLSDVACLVFANISYLIIWFNGCKVYYVSIFCLPYLKIDVFVERYLMLNEFYLMNKKRGVYVIQKYIKKN